MPSDKSSTAVHLREATPTLWINPDRLERSLIDRSKTIAPKDIEDARARFVRFRPLLQVLFPELRASGGVIESPLLAAPTLQAALGLPLAHGQLLIKADHSLQVAGSIKARGGIHEVLEFAEELAQRNGLLEGGNYASLANESARAVFRRHQVAVGSTGNLGLSIGIVASALGFRTVVHMSADAKEWKKERLRKRDVLVIEHDGDYADAVAAGRRQAESEPLCHFVDDENSSSLFLGYSAAAGHLREQLELLGVKVDADHPLFVYLPCGVGGAPGGIAFGLAHYFGKHVHCFFAEPTQSPCFLARMLARDGEHPSVYDVGLTNRTEADGLAVPRASELAAVLMRPIVAGVFTVEDETMFRHLRLAHTTEQLRIEPSASVGFGGPAMVCESESGRAYLQSHGLSSRMHQATHVIWTTGGLFVPQTEYEEFLARGASLDLDIPTPS
ncbi:MAG: D-serine ammonia-lyase [Proteobacteria bacterium]|nr:D-serine ammonia-lyase [Pseudomonadota bacterium]